MGSTDGLAKVIAAPDVARAVVNAQQIANGTNKKKCFHATNVRKHFHSSFIFRYQDLNIQSNHHQRNH